MLEALITLERLKDGEFIFLNVYSKLKEMHKVSVLFYATCLENGSVYFGLAA